MYIQHQIINFMKLSFSFHDIREKKIQTGLEVTKSTIGFINLYSDKTFNAKRSYVGQVRLPQDTPGAKKCSHEKRDGLTSLLTARMY